jgi:hypothetical protein
MTPSKPAGCKATDAHMLLQIMKMQAFFYYTTICDKQAILLAS